LLKACQKRPVPMAKLAEAIDEVESALADSPEREIPATAIGEMLMKRLRPWTISPIFDSLRCIWIFRMSRRL